MGEKMGRISLTKGQGLPKIFCYILCLPNTYLPRYNIYMKNKTCKRGHPWPESKANNGRCRRCRTMYKNKHPTPSSRRIHKEAKIRRYNESKLAALAHYGPNRQLQCSWPDCKVTDVDMLCLDHIKDNGHEERTDPQAPRVIKNGGKAFMNYLRTHEWPDGYQTLCGGHNFKKQIMHLRGETTPVD